MGNLCKKEQKSHAHPHLVNSKPHKLANQEFIKTTIQFVSETQFENWQQKVNTQPANHNISFMPKSQDKDQNKVLNLKGSLNKLRCGSFYEAQVLYPAHWLLLEQQLNKIRNLNKGDSEKIVQQHKIWQLLNNLVQLASIYHHNGQKVGDIQPDNILISGDGYLKVFTQDSWPNQTTNYKKTVQSKKITYLSPQQQHDAVIGFLEQSTPFDQGEAFSIGLTCLDVVLATISNGSASQIYQIKQELKTNILQQMIDVSIRQSNYSAQLLACILVLIEKQPSARMKASDLSDWLNQNFNQQQKSCPKIDIECPEKLKNKYEQLKQNKKYQNDDNNKLIDQQICKKQQNQLIQEQQNNMKQQSQEKNEDNQLVFDGSNEVQSRLNVIEQQPILEQKISNSFRNQQKLGQSPKKTIKHLKGHRIRSRNVVNYD